MRQILRSRPDRPRQPAWRAYPAFSTHGGTGSRPAFPAHAVEHTAAGAARSGGQQGCLRCQQHRPTEDGAESIIVELPAPKASACADVPLLPAHGRVEIPTRRRTMLPPLLRPDTASALLTLRCVLPRESRSAHPVCAVIRSTTRPAPHADAWLYSFGARTAPASRKRRWRPPLATCSNCGDHKPCHNADTDSPRCPNCTARLHQEPCERCGTVRPVWGRAEDGSALCEACTRRKEPCHICGQVRRVHGRPPDGPLCKSDTSRSV